jgi:hypothetical protein
VTSIFAAVEPTAGIRRLVGVVGACPASLASAIANAGGMGGLGARTTPSNGITNWVREFRAGDDKRSGFSIAQNAVLWRKGSESGSQLTCMGLFLSSGVFWVLLTVLCSERERPFFVPSPAIRFPERAEGVKGPKR